MQEKYKMKYNPNSIYFKESEKPEVEDQDIEEPVDESVVELLSILRDENFGSESQRKLFIDVITSLHNSTSPEAKKFFKVLGDYATDAVNDILEMKEEFEDVIIDKAIKATIKKFINTLDHLVQGDDEIDTYAVIIADAVLSKNIKFDVLIKRAKEEMEYNRNFYESKQLKEVGGMFPGTAGTGGSEFNDRKANPLDDLDNDDEFEKDPPKQVAAHVEDTVEDDMSMEESYKYSESGSQLDNALGSPIWHYLIAILLDEVHNDLLSPKEVKIIEQLLNGKLDKFLNLPIIKKYAIIPDWQMGVSKYLEVQKELIKNGVSIFTADERIMANLFYGNALEESYKYESRTQKFFESHEDNWDESEKLEKLLFSKYNFNKKQIDVHAFGQDSIEITVDPNVSKVDIIIDLNDNKIYYKIGSKRFILPFSEKNIVTAIKDIQNDIND